MRKKIVIVVFIVAGLLFIVYWNELRREIVPSPPRRQTTDYNAVQAKNGVFRIKKDGETTMNINFTHMVSKNSDTKTMHFSEIEFTLVHDGLTVSGGAGTGEYDSKKKVVFLRRKPDVAIQAKSITMRADEIMITPNKNSIDMHRRVRIRGPAFTATANESTYVY